MIDYKEILIYFGDYMENCHSSAEKFDPKTEEFLDRFSAMVSLSKNLSLPEARKLSTAFFSTPKNALEQVGSVIDETVSVDDGNITIRVITPKSGRKAPFPILLFFHQGGWVFGGIEESESFCRKLANRAGCVVAVVGYRLAPEHQFPQPVDDCYRAVEWMRLHAERFSANRDLIGVAGASAGANLAASVALIARDKKEFTLSLQLLLYPLLTPQIDEKSYSKCPGQRFMSFDSIKMFWDLYLKKPADGLNPYASPLEANHLQDLPQALIVTAEFDPLRPQADLYAKRLAHDGNRVTLRTYSAVIHGFLELPIELPQKEQAIQEVAEMVKGMFLNNL